MLFFVICGFNFLILRTQMPLFVNLSLFREIIGPERRYWAEMVLNFVYFVQIATMGSYNNPKRGKCCR